MVRGKNNCVKVKNKKQSGKLKIYVSGSNNEIIIENISIMQNLDVKNCCNNSKIVINNILSWRKSTIYNGYDDPKQTINNSEIIIGNNVHLNSAFIFNPHSNSSIEIKPNCLISDEISIRNTDGHPIYDINTKECINKQKDGFHILIEEHVWIGYGVTILKNCKVPRDSIVGSNAIVAKRFDTPNVVIAGNPAKIIKENVTWTKENVGFFN